MPDNETPAVEEGGTLTFSVNASDPDEDPLTYYWTLNGTRVSAADSWIYSPDYTESGMKMVNVTISDGNLTVSKEWFVTVINININPPNITYFYPYDKNITIKRDCINFSANASDPMENL